MSIPKQVFRLELTPVNRNPDDTRPPVVRLRALLKFALRSCGLKCVDVIEIKDDDISKDTVA